MNKNDALISTSIINSLWEISKKDFLDIIKPFVLYLISISSEKTLNIDHVIKSLYTDFGFKDFPINVLDKILKRLCHEKAIKCIDRQKRLYEKADKAINVDEFCSIWESSKEHIRFIISDMCSYFKQNFLTLLHIDEKETERIFIDFLNRKGYTCFRNYDSLEFLSNKDGTDFWVGTYILFVKDNNERMFSYIMETIKGLMITKAMYIQVEDYESFNSKFKNVTFYFDTTLLLNILGCSTKIDKDSSHELLKLLRKQGANFKYFTHNFEELYNILTAYANGIGRYSAQKTLQFFDEHDYSKEQVERFRDAIIDKLDRLEIHISETPSFENGSLNKKVYIDEEALANLLKENFEGYREKDNILNNDISSITSICRLRNGRECTSIETCKAIFVTTNTKLVDTINRFFSADNKLFEQSIIIDDISLTTITWLKTHDEKSDLPVLRLISEALASVNPSKVFWTTVIKVIINLEAEGEISSQEAMALRASTFMQKECLSLTGGNPENINKSVILRAKKRYEEEIGTRYTNELSSLNAENTFIKQELTEFVEKQRQGTQDVLKNIRDKSIRISGYASRTTGIVINSILLGAFIIFLVFIILDIVNKEPVFTIGMVILIIVNILSLVDLIFSRRAIASKVRYTIKRNVYNYVFQNEIRKAKRYNPNIQSSLSDATNSN